MDWFSLNFFSCLRKCRRWWHFFTMDEMLTSHERSLEITVPRNLKESTCSTCSPLISKGASGSFFRRKSIIISFVLDTLSSRLFSEHQPTNRSTSPRYTLSSSFEMSPSTVVSSENLITTTDESEETQSLVNKVNKRGERTHPWGVPVFKMAHRENILLILTTWGRHKRKSRSQWQMEGWTFMCNNLSNSLWGMMVLKAELKSINKTLA